MVEKWDYCFDRLERVVTSRARPGRRGPPGAAPAGTDGAKGAGGGDSDDEVFQQLAGRESSARNGMGGGGRRKNVQKEVKSTKQRNFFFPLYSSVIPTWKFWHWIFVPHLFSPPWTTAR